MESQQKTRRLLIVIIIILSIILAILLKACQILENNKKIEVVVTTISTSEAKTSVNTEPTVIGTQETQKNYEEDLVFQDRCRLTYAEATGESIIGQIAVAAVVINREECVEFPDTFYEVINQSGQFSVVKNGEIYSGSIVNYEDISQETINAVKRALGGEDPTEQLLWEEAERLGLDPIKYAEGGALYFYNPDGCSDAELKFRANIKVKIRIGNHVFYKYWDQPEE